MLMMRSFVGDQILHVDLAFIGHDLGQTRGGVFSLNLAQLFFDDLKDALLFRQNVAQVFDRLDQLLVFVDDFLALQPGQLIKAQIKNLIRLMFAESITAIREARFVANQDADLFDLPAGEFEGQQFDSRFFAIGRAANDANKFVQVRERDEVTFERLGALFGFAQFVAGAAEDDFAPVLDEGLVRFLKREQFRLAVIDREHVDRERGLHRGVLVEIVDHDLRQRVALQFDDDARVLIRLVANRA